MTRKHPQRRLRTSRLRGASRRGATLVEFALVLPVLMLIVLGCVDFGRFAHYHIALTNAAGAAAHFASFHPYTAATQSTWTAKTKQAAADEMQGVAGYNAAKLNVLDPVLIVEESNGRLRRVQVEARYTFDTLVTWPGIPNSVVLTRRVEMRVVR